MFQLNNQTELSIIGRGMVKNAIFLFSLKSREKKEVVHEDSISDFLQRCPPIVKKLGSHPCYYRCLPASVFVCMV